ncbi:hypothetical protein A9Q85_07555 [Cycloclasticus sp. 44_32_T64]|nr:hypothetical protein A9Q85_07555 [Cycloclasticus sp. 44_32_T64]
MPFQRKLLVLILVLCSLGYSTAWAFDEHVIGEASHTVDVNVMLDEHTEQVTDHCGHISAHLVGLFSELNFLINEKPLIVYLHSPEHFISFVPQTQLRPPNV